MCENCRTTKDKNEWVCRFNGRYYNEQQLSQMSREFLILIYHAYGGEEDVSRKHRNTIVSMIMSAY